MPDFGNREFLEMVCVETANCGPNPVILAHGKTHDLRLDIHVQNDMKQKIV
jgi:D-hexose-6-phosphate mutarotase